MEAESGSNHIVPIEMSLNRAPQDRVVASKVVPDERATSSPDEQEGRSNRKTALIMLALCMAVFLAALDVTIITTALPTIAAHFKTTLRQYSWIGSAYLLTSAAIIPSSGKISNIFGRKPILLVANMVFLIGSLICSLAVNIEMLIVGRAFQGVGAGAITNLVTICISDLFSERLVENFFKALF